LPVFFCLLPGMVENYECFHHKGASWSRTRVAVVAAAAALPSLRCRRCAAVAALLPSLRCR
jgi:hypothetical protein